MDLYGSIAISASGMKAQSTRIRILSENVANASTGAITPEDEPYVRKTVSFKNVLDRETGFDFVDINRIDEDRTQPFPTRYIPNHPGADENGYVRMPNVNPLVEMNDMREAQRTFEANLGMIEQSRNMILQTIGLLRQ